MLREAVIEFVEDQNLDSDFIGSGTRQVGRDIYRVTLRLGARPVCTINGVDYVNSPGRVDLKMSELLVAVRKRFCA